LEGHSLLLRLIGGRLVGRFACTSCGRALLRRRVRVVSVGGSRATAVDGAVAVVAVGDDRS
jgi:hypothetical protein